MRLQAVSILLPRLLVVLLLLPGGVDALFRAAVGGEILLLNKFPDRDEGVGAVRVAQPGGGRLALRELRFLQMED